VVAIRTQWKSVSDSLNFWSADYGDTEADKLALIKEMSQSVLPDSGVHRYFTQI
jgi:chemotaxis receptor (MCP) glutamine deamidase CheD